VSGSKKIFVCTDLDRTIIPNGLQEESAYARPLLRRLAERPDIYLAYVSGRDKNLILDAIEEFCLPVPDYAIGDVGTTLYTIINGSWQPSDDWTDEIGQDWKGLDREQLAELLADIKELRLQEPEKQNRYKLSYYCDQHIDRRKTAVNIRGRFVSQGVDANIIWSIDELCEIGLLDIVPTRANKLHAIHFLMRQEQFPDERTVFAGDSGNDLDVLTSGLQSILVKNAAQDVRQEAIETLAGKQMTNRLYVSRGNFFGMNGNYAAGVMEGLVHFIPETEIFIAETVERIESSISFPEN
jgi:HAD superfamily hydrolase (TIGR01484 family)